MRRGLLLLLATAVYMPLTHGQALDFEWVKSPSATRDALSRGVATHTTGEIAWGGVFDGLATFDAIILDSVQPSGAVPDEDDGFVAKLDPDGTVLWVRQVAAPFSTFPNDPQQAQTMVLDVAFDADGNVLACGQYGQSATVDGGGNPSVALPAGGANEEMFVAKYSPGGDLQWVNYATGSFRVAARSVAADDSGNVIITGNFAHQTFNGNMSFPGGSSFNSFGGGDGFLAKYDSNGNFLWARQIGSAARPSDDPQDVTVDSGGNILVTGQFLGTASFGGGSVASAGSRDAFIAKYDPNGNLLWVRRGGGSGDDRGIGVVADSAGNVFVSGRFEGTATFEGQTVVGAGSVDMFVAEYDPAGALVWVRQYGGSGSTDGRRMALDPVAGSIWVSGFFTQQATFGATTLISGGDRDSFVVELDLQGNPLAAQSAGGSASDLALDVSVFPSGDVLLAGYYGAFSGGTAAFGDITLTTAGLFDAYLAKLSSPSQGCSDPATISYQGFTASQCAAPQNAVTVNDQEELDAYMTDFGFDGAKVKNVKVNFNPTGDVTIISPCEVHLNGLNNYLDINADKLCVYGRKGITVANDASNPDRGVTAGAVALISEEGDAGFFKGLEIIAEEIVVQAAGEVKVGLDNFLDVEGAVALISTGDTPGSNAIIRQNSEVSAQDVLLMASRGATIGNSVVLDASGDVVIESTGTAVKSLAEISQGAQVSAATLTQTSGNKSKVGQNASVSVVGEYHMNADGACSIASSASINAGLTSGNCLP